jgi:hypothetical protein
MTALEAVVQREQAQDLARDALGLVRADAERDAVGAERVERLAHAGIQPGEPREGSAS